MSHPLKSPDTPSAISSPASASGPSPCAAPVGLMTAPSGRGAALANLSARQVRELGLQTSGTYGPPGSTSSRSVGLQSSLESSLRKRLNGSDLWRVIWKEWVTPWGAVLSKPRALARSTSGIASGSLPTPSGTSNHGKNHVSGRLDEWGGSSNPFRGTPIGKVHCVPFELWVMGLPDAWAVAMPPAMPSYRRSRLPSSKATAKPAS